MAKQDRKKDLSGAFGGLLSSSYMEENQEPEVEEKQSKKPKRKTPAKSESPKPTKHNKMMEGITGKKEYQMVRIDQRNYNKMAKIAKKHNVPYPGTLINAAIEKWIEQYEAEENAD